MNRFLSKCMLLVFLASQAVTNADDTGPARDVPELQALQSYIGTWDVVNAGDPSTKGEATTRWILGGRIVEQTGFLLSGNGTDRVEFTTFYTFDTTRKSYRSWTFASTGSPNQAEMTWNAKEKTMTSVTRPDANGDRATVTADFSGTGKELWKVVFTNRGGNVVGELRGENTLRKSSATATMPAAEKDFSDRSKELKVLDRFLGHWRTEYRLPKAEWTPEEKRGSADLVYTRELGGQFIRERGMHSDKTTATMLVTFDADRQNYHAWWFNSLGHTSETIGRWDEKSQTLFWTGIEPDDFKSTSQHQFLNSGKYDWKVLVEDKQGMALFRMEGISLQVKYAKK